MTQTNENISCNPRIKKPDTDQLSKLTSIQESLVTEAAVYSRIAKKIKSKENAHVLSEISEEKHASALELECYTRKTPSPNNSRVSIYSWLASALGFTFAVKFMEKNKRKIRRYDRSLSEKYPELIELEKREEQHSSKLLGMLNEERLEYVGSMVLGMNDAMVEMSGTLAGLTLAMQNTRLIALSGLITGIAATLSMAASEYLSTKADGHPHPIKSSAYTGVTYLVTVALLILPYLLYNNDHYLWAMFTMVAIMLVILVIFNFYLSVAKDLSFRKRFGSMAAISLGVSALSFVLGIFVKMFLGVDV